MFYSTSELLLGLICELFEGTAARRSCYTFETATAWQDSVSSYSHALLVFNPGHMSGSCCDTIPVIIDDVMPRGVKGHQAITEYQAPKINYVGRLHNYVEIRPATAGFRIPTSATARFGKKEPSANLAQDMCSNHVFKT